MATKELRKLGGFHKAHCQLSEDHPGKCATSNLHRYWCALDDRHSGKCKYEMSSLEVSDIILIIDPSNLLFYGKIGTVQSILFDEYSRVFYMITLDYNKIVHSFSREMLKKISSESASSLASIINMLERPSNETEHHA